VGEGGGWLDSVDVLYLFIYSVPHPFHTDHWRIYIYVSGETKLYRFHFQAHWSVAKLSLATLKRNVEGRNAAGMRQLIGHSCRVGQSDSQAQRPDNPNLSVELISGQNS
jgi:hypothetical protein